MGIGYQRTDRNVLDYKLWYLKDIPFALRGPRRWTGSRPYFVFVGAAQTFGRFAQNPYPELVSSWMGMEHINFGFAGAGPELFLRHKPLLEQINQSSICFLQVMSGRSVSTKLLTAVGNGGSLQFNQGPLAGKTMVAHDAYHELLKSYPREQVVEQVNEARIQWVKAYEQLIAEIRVPIVLVRISSAPPPKSDDFSSAHKLLGPFPQLIGEQQLGRLASAVSRLIDCVLPSESPQLLLNRTTQRPEEVFSAADFPTWPQWSRCYNAYYPTPRMHMFIADKIRVAMTASA
jgi:hypothetical protein